MIEETITPEIMRRLRAMRERLSYEISKNMFDVAWKVEIVPKTTILEVTITVYEYHMCEQFALIQLESVSDFEDFVQYKTQAWARKLGELVWTKPKAGAQ